MNMDLKQLPYHSTLMGCIVGAAKFYKIELSDVLLYGLSGHAFVISVRSDLCPSGPYVWDMSVFQNLCQNFGCYPKMNQVVFLDKNSKSEFIVKCEEKIKEKMDEGTVCMLVSLEHQLFNEYTEDSFVFTKPWGNVPSERSSITYGEWNSEINGFTFIEKINKNVSIKNAINQSLYYAIALIEKIKADDLSYLGICAYDYWIECVTKGHGSSHGNWWNGTVWAECKSFASKYFLEIIHYGFDEVICQELSMLYKEVSELLFAIKDKEQNEEEKINCLKKAKALEKRAAKKIKKLLK